MKKFDSLINSVLTCNKSMFVETYELQQGDTDVIYAMAGDSEHMGLMERFTPQSSNWMYLNLDSKTLTCSSMQHAVEQFLHAAQHARFSNTKPLSTALINHIYKQLEKFEDVSGTWFGGSGAWRDVGVIGIKIDIEFYRKHLKQAYQTPLIDLIDL